MIERGILKRRAGLNLKLLVQLQVVFGKPFFLILVMISQLIRL